MSQSLLRLGRSDPRHLGPYRLRGVLGGSELGRVYLGRGAPRRSVRTRTVAVRALRPELLRDRQSRARLRHDLTAGARCASRWTTPIHDFELDSDLPWTASPLAPGVSLRRLVTRYGPLPEQALGPLGGALARGVAALHDAGACHRAVRPGKVLLHLDHPRLVEPGLALTTPDAGPAEDVRQLATALVFAAVARDPFRQTLTPLTPQGPDLTGVPTTLQSALRACLHPEPARRPTPQELARTLDPQSWAEEPAQFWLPEMYALEIEAHQAALRRRGGRRFG